MATAKNKTVVELKKAFRSSIQYLRQEINLALKKDYADEMRFQSAITIATRLRMLLNDGGRNKSLLEQLFLKKKLLFNLSRETVDLASNLVFSTSLLSICVKDSHLFWAPNIVKQDYNVGGFFDEWWNEIIIDDKEREPNQISRRDVVLTLCDKEGGAHMDPDYDDAYYSIQFENGWKIVLTSGEEKSTENNPYAESVFVIAEEFLIAMERYDMLASYSVRDASSSYNLLCIKYPGIKPRLEVHRFAFNTRQHINDVLRIAYDYYREAEYYLVDLKFKRYYDQKNKLVSQVLVVDRMRERPLYYLRKENGDRYVLLGDDKGLYRLITEDNDIYKLEAGKPLESLIEELGSV